MMKKVSFAIVGAAALALAACGGKHDEDMINNADQATDNAVDLNAVANDTSDTSANMQAEAADANKAEAPKDEVPADDSDANAAEVQAM